MGLNGFLSFVLILFCVQSFAAPEERNTSHNQSQRVCVNKTSEDNDKLLESFRDNNDPLKVAFLETRKKREALKECVYPQMEKELGFFDLISKNIFSTHQPPETILVQDTKKDLLELTKKPETHSPTISRECIEASLRRQPGNDGYTCRYPTAKEAKRGFDPRTQSIPTKYGTAGGDTLQCVNNEMVDYMHFAVNKAIDCMSAGRPIDSRAIFQKLNNETGFNPSIAYSGGIGIGQMTTPAIQELTTDAGKGKYIFEAIANSPKDSCQPFKHIAKKDLKSYPRVRPGNYCSYTNMGDGLARSLIYGIGYYITMRDEYLIPALDARSSKMVSNEELVSKLAAISYGREGIKHAKWLMQKYRINERTNTKTFINALQKESTYLKETASKMHEVHCLQKGLEPSSPECKGLVLSPEELGADTCVSQ